MAHCPKCDSLLVPVHGRYGWFLGCPNYPECKGSLSMEHADSCPLCKSSLSIAYSNDSGYRIRTVLCSNLDCTFSQTVSRVRIYSRQSRSFKSLQAGWSDATEKDYDDYLGFDSSSFGDN